MLRGILVGLDGSPFSDGAVSLGLKWAKATGAVLAGEVVIDRPGLSSPETVPTGSGLYRMFPDDKKIAEARAKAEHHAAAFLDRCAAAGVVCKQVMEVGDPRGEHVEKFEHFMPHSGMLPQQFTSGLQRR